MVKDTYPSSDQVPSAWSRDLPSRLSCFEDLPSSDDLAGQPSRCHPISLSQPEHFR